MIIKCPNCDAALIFNPELGKLQCIACDSTFEPDYYNNQRENTQVSEERDEQINHAEKNTDSQYKSPDSQNMRCNIYTCTACGAELAVNGVESSTYCAYCGQPTIVFSRVSDELQPKYIIPFKVTKDEAIGLLRKRLKKGFYIPKGIKNFEIEKVRGIYIPFFLFDIHYYDYLHLTGRVRRGKSTVTKHYLREASCDFTKFTVDASRNLLDESSQRLEPYNMEELKPFQVSYMTGYYADRYDEKISVLEQNVKSRANMCFNEEVKKSVKASNVCIVESHPKIDLMRSEYALLPAWFLTFRYEDVPYTMLVNGQTGKVVGTVPYQKAKAIALLIVLFIIFSVIGTAFFYELISATARVDKADGTLKLLALFGVIGVTTFAAAVRKYKKFMENLKLTTSRKTERFSKERQDD